MKKTFLKLSQKLSELQIQFLLVLAYVLIICPTSLLWKIFRKDPLNKKWIKSERSYMISKKKNTAIQFEKPY